MLNITFELSGLHTHGPAFFDYLRLRKRFFVDHLGWNIPHDEKYEMDQYDNPKAWYSLVLDNGYVLAGARVMPTNAEWGEHTYMMGDAARGTLSSIPSAQLPSGIRAPEVWEMTRLVMCESVTCPNERRRVLQKVCDGCVDIVKSHHCLELRAMSSLAMMRLLRQAGYPVDRLGDTWRDQSDGRIYSAMKMDIPAEHYAIAAE